MIEQLLQADRMLQVDQIERARSMYQAVVDLDPNNAIAVVGLARCALADEDDALAYQLASRALEVDPENDMARRMEARLSEIMATRGEEVASTLTLPPKRRGREQAGGCQVLLFAACLTRPDGTSARVP